MRQCLSTVKDMKTVVESHKWGNNEDVTGNQNRQANKLMNHSQDITDVPVSQSS